MSDPDDGSRIAQLEAENARLRRLLDQQGVSGALRHRIRNVLGLLRVILRRSAEHKTTLEDYAAHLEGRFDALFRVETALLASPDGRVDLETLVSDELLAHTVGEVDRTTIAGPALRLDARRAELLGFALHELGTNALKFGALTTPNGRIDVAWTLSPGRLRLVWEESGRSGPSVFLRGFGMEAIEDMLPYQFRADTGVEFLSEGMRCTIVLPLGTEGG